ncbi:MAG: DUF501 domain-containing protein [Candidatus Nanopelagicales bacterium]
MVEPVTSADLAVAAAQLGREMRAVAGVAHRCGCGSPDVLVTRPVLPDGTPFPTCYYLTCPRANSAIGTLEAGGLMAEMTSRLAGDADLAAAYLAAHEAYLRDRAQFGQEPRIAAVSAGGMPTRVKCLHVLAAHALAAGPGVNPLGDEVLQRLAGLGITPARHWGAAGACIAG